jgi:hypothetical protein
VIDFPERSKPVRDELVVAWDEPVMMPTYPVPLTDRNPMFLEKHEC